MFLHFPQEVHDKIHGAPVVEFLLKLHALAGHLYAHEHVQEARY